MVGTLGSQGGGLRAGLLDLRLGSGTLDLRVDGWGLNS